MSVTILDSMPALTIPSSLEEIVEREREAFGDFGPNHREWLLQKAPRNVRRWLERERERQARGLPPIVATGQQFWAPITPPVAADFNARNTFTTEVALLSDTISGAPPQAYVDRYCAIAPGLIQIGSEFRLKAAGVYGTTGTPTIAFTPRWGKHVTIGTNVSLGISQTATCGSGVSAQPWWIEFDVQVRADPAGATAATVKGHGYALLGSTNVVITMGSTAATVDTSGQGTAGSGLQMGVTWGTSSASNTITPQNYRIYSLGV